MFLSLKLFYLNVSESEVGQAVLLSPSHAGDSVEELSVVISLTVRPLSHL